MSFFCSKHKDRITSTIWADFCRKQKCPVYGTTPCQFAHDIPRKMADGSDLLGIGLSARAHEEQTKFFQHKMDEYFRLHLLDLDEYRELLREKFMLDRGLILLNCESFEDMMIRCNLAKRNDESKRVNRKPLFSRKKKPKKEFEKKFIPLEERKD